MEYSKALKLGKSKIAWLRKKAKDNFRKIKNSMAALVKTLKQDEDKQKNKETFAKAEQKNKETFAEAEQTRQELNGDSKTISTPVETPKSKPTEETADDIAKRAERVQAAMEKLEHSGGAGLNLDVALKEINPNASTEELMPQTKALSEEIGQIKTTEKTVKTTTTKKVLEERAANEEAAAIILSDEEQKQKEEKEKEEDEEQKQKESTSDDKNNPKKVAVAAAAPLIPTPSFGNEGKK